jgi:hypothetical protein
MALANTPRTRTEIDDPIQAAAKGATAKVTIGLAPMVCRKPNDLAHVRASAAFGTDARGNGEDCEIAETVQDCS